MKHGLRALRQRLSPIGPKSLQRTPDLRKRRLESSRALKCVTVTESESLRKKATPSSRRCPFMCLQKIAPALVLTLVSCAATTPHSPVSLPAPSPSLTENQPAFRLLRLPKPTPSTPESADNGKHRRYDGGTSTGSCRKRTCKRAARVNQAYGPNSPHLSSPDSP